MTKKELIKELNKYKQLSLTDELTQLGNRRKLKQDIKSYIARIFRTGENYTLIMFDIDRFKKINDTKGHKEGDKILKRVGKILKNNVRQDENAYRLSGDEFIIIIRNGDPMKVIGRIQKSLSKIEIEISYGVGYVREGILEFVDKEMYRMKRRK